MTTMSDRERELQERTEKDIAIRQKGFNGYCGAEFEVVSADRCLVSVELTEKLMNPMGIAHGGLVATLTDIAAGALARRVDEYMHETVTQNCDIHDVRPGTGARLRAESRILRKGKRVCTIGVECFSGVGKLCAEALYDVAYLPKSEEQG